MITKLILILEKAMFGGAFSHSCMYLHKAPDVHLKINMLKYLLDGECNTKDKAQVRCYI